MNLRKTALAAAVCGALLPGAASAVVTIDGISFAAGAVFSTVTLWEGDSTTGGPITAAGQSLTIYGRVNQITDAATSTVIWNASATRELTFVGTGFTSLAGPPSVNFSGGSITLYSDSTPDSVVGGPGGTTGFTDGTPWLVLTPQVLNSAIFPGGVTLTSVVIPFSPVTGFGFLDVTGGSAAANFDTNSFTPATLPVVQPLYAGALAAGEDADIFFTSQGSLTGQNGWAFNGSGNIYAQALPEPGSVALLGLGLAALAGMSRRRKQS